jgi:hypothetical protein
MTAHWITRQEFQSLSLHTQRNLAREPISEWLSDIFNTMFCALLFSFCIAQRGDRIARRISCGWWSAASAIGGSQGNPIAELDRIVRNLRMIVRV